MPVYIPFPSGSEAEQPIIPSERSIIDIADAAKMLHTYSSVSEFEDEQWLIDKINEDRNLMNNRRTISFLKIANRDNCVILKIAAVMKLMRHLSVRNIAKLVWTVRKFLFITQSQDTPFAEITSESILTYYNHLFNSSLHGSREYNLSKWFVVKDFFKISGFQKQYRLMDQYIMERPPDKRRIEGKLIPEEVAQKLDIIFFKDNIPLPFRVMYWSLRLIPNRIHEVLSMKMNCLKKLNSEYYIVSIPTFKQAGPYSLGNIKLIEIKYCNMGQYYIDLLKDFIKQRKNESHSVDDDFLFYAYRHQFKSNQNGEYHFSCCKAPYSPLTIDRVSALFKNVCKRCNIRTENGEPYSVTSHQFRHNAISDRINSGIFRSIEVQGLTYHHSTAMIDQTYTHQDVRTMVESAPIIFKGRIINSVDERQINKLLERPYAKRIYKLGICSDVRNCDKDKSQCLRCKYMIPDANDLDYYEQELQDWHAKQKKAELIGNEIFAELCEDWIVSYETLINRVLKALTNEDVTIAGGTPNEATQ